MKTTKSTKSIQLTSGESDTLLAALQLAQNAVADLEEYKTFSKKLRDLETTVRQQS
jgi:hypothetical protein